MSPATPSTATPTPKARTRPSAWFAWMLAASACAGQQEAPEPHAPPSASPQTRENEAPTPKAGPESPPEDEDERTPAEGSEEQPPDDPRSLSPSRSTSIGTPVEGSLEGGVALPLVADGLRFNPAKDPLARHGTVELVSALLDAAETVHEKHPGGELTVGDLSMPQGGDIPGHASHRSGRDVDVLFYLLDDQGAPAPSKAVPIEPTGWGVDYRDLSTPADDVPLQLDVPRTWSFLEALALDEDIHVNRVYIAEHIRTRLLEHARAAGAPKHAIDRVGAWTCQPRFPHDDHMHIRLYCSAQDIEKGCEDTRPIYPWHAQHLRRAGTKVEIAGRRTKPAPKLTSNESAAEKAKEKYGEFAPEVTAFLERRKSWARKPHPGRPFCP